jgi:hypothetical protein
MWSIWPAISNWFELFELFKLLQPVNCFETMFFNDAASLMQACFVKRQNDWLVRFAGQLVSWFGRLVWLSSPNQAVCALQQFCQAIVLAWANLDC